MYNLLSKFTYRDVLLT